MAERHFLSIDIGTGSVRAGLVSSSGRVLKIASREHEQIVPRFGWSEQRPEDWWSGVVEVVRQIVDWAAKNECSIEAVCACGQMHGTVLIDEQGRSILDAVPLWNDKRTLDLVAAFERENKASDYLPLTGNPASPAWPGFKLQWIHQHHADAYERSVCVLMPKDFVNFRLTGEIAIDRTDAALSFLMDPKTNTWSPRMVEKLGLSIDKLPVIRNPIELLGTVTGSAADETGLRPGTPVLVGGGDYPLAMLGSGVDRPGLASEVAGTSSIISVISENPVLDAEICNVGTVDGKWAAFTLLESGGDAVRWARRALQDADIDYEKTVDRASQAPVGSDGLFFLPYLVGERLGAHRNSRAQFFGLAAGHGNSHLHRAVMEGVAFAIARQLETMRTNDQVDLERLVASGGGARADLWLRIKASALNLEIVVPEEPECGLVGCAALSAYATGQFDRLTDAVSAFVRFDRSVKPDPEWVEKYAAMQPVFNDLYEGARQHYDKLDALAQPNPGNASN